MAERALMNALTKAAQDVLAERQRQIEAEGWTPEHDDEHTDGSMARAAAAYCLCAEGPPRPGEPSEFHSSRPWDFNILRAIWPRSWSWPTPKDKRTNLVRAAALILAEIERRDRAADKAGAPEVDLTAARPAQRWKCNRCRRWHTEEACPNGPGDQAIAHHTPMRSEP